MPQTWSETIPLSSSLGRTLAKDAGNFSDEPIAKHGQTITAERIGWLYIGGISEVEVYACKCSAVVHIEGECVR